MTGSPAEQNLLGAVLLEPKINHAVADLVSGEDFEDARLGTVFDHLMARIGRGQPVAVETVDTLLPDWGVLGLGAGSAFRWIDAGRCRPFSAPEYARAVRTDSVRRSLRTTVTAIGERLTQGWDAVDVASRASTELAGIIDGASTGVLQTKTLDEILQGSDEYDWLIPHLLERKDRLIVTGPEGSGKTTWVRQMCVLSAAGINPVTFEQIRPLKVLVVDAENTERQWRRATRLVVADAARAGVVNPGANIHVAAGHRIDITRGSHLSEIHRLIDIHKPDAVFIGPLYKLVNRAITNDDDAAPLIVALDSLRERDVALVMEAHAGKAAGADGTRDLRPRGSAALLGWPEFGLGLRPDPEEPNCVDVVRWRGDRDQRSWPKRMYRGHSWPWQPIA